jgi:hypothetical protein
MVSSNGLTLQADPCRQSPTRPRITAVHGATMQRLFSRGELGSGLYRVPAAGGTPIQLTAVDAAHNEIEHTWPYFLPDGHHFLFLDLLV